MNGNTRERLRSILIVAAVIIVAAILGAICGRLLLDNLI